MPPLKVVKSEEAVPPLQVLFRDYAPYLWRVMRRMGIGDGEVDDLCQEIFLTAHRKRVGFEGRSSVKTWLYGICLRVVSDHRRRAHVRREHLVARPPELSAAPEQLEALDQRRARELLDQVLSSLDDDRRAAFVLYEIEDLPLRKIAEVMEVPLQTAYSRLKSARKEVEDAFRRALDPNQDRMVGGNA